MAFILDDTIKLNISDFSQWGYLNSDNPKSGTIKFLFDNVVGFELKVVTNHLKHSHSVVIEFLLDDLVCTQVLCITYLHSNLGKGSVPYFLCPKTNKLCRKLYLYNSNFTSRESIPNSMYSSQIVLKSIRDLDKTLKRITIIEDYKKLADTKYFKPVYKDKPTKAVIRFQNKLRKP